MKGNQIFFNDIKLHFFKPILDMKLYHIKFYVFFYICFFFSWFLKNVCQGLNYIKEAGKERKERGKKPNEINYLQNNWI